MVCGSLTPSYGTEEEFNLGKRTQRAGEGNDEEVNEETQAELVLSPLREGALKRQKTEKLLNTRKNLVQNTNINSSVAAKNDGEDSIVTDTLIKKSLQPKIFKLLNDNECKIASFKQVETSGDGNHCFFNSLTKNGVNREVLAPITNNMEQEILEGLGNETFNDMVRTQIVTDILTNLDKKVDIVQGSQDASMNIKEILQQDIVE